MALSNWVTSRGMAKGRKNWDVSPAERKGLTLHLFPEVEPLENVNCVAMIASHPFARLKSIPLEKLATQPLVVLRRKEYSGFHNILARIFAPISAKTANRGGMRRRQGQTGIITQ